MTCNEPLKSHLPKIVHIERRRYVTRHFLHAAIWLAICGALFLPLPYVVGKGVLYSIGGIFLTAGLAGYHLIQTLRRPVFMTLTPDGVSFPCELRRRLPWDDIETVEVIERHSRFWKIWSHSDGDALRINLTHQTKIKWTVARYIAEAFTWRGSGSLTERQRIDVPIPKGVDTTPHEVQEMLRNFLRPSSS
ncbi:MAG: hypothetical protein RIC16_04570 [Rhodospirillales bacterium]